MKQCAFLTLDNPTGFVIDDQLAYPPLRDLGWHCESVPWTHPAASWADYDAVIIRSTWDYTNRPNEFLATLRRIEASGAPLFNGLELVRWNLEKTYLRELAERGVPIVPTTWCDRLHAGQLRPLLEALGEAVVKPVVGAGAVGAFRLDRHADRAQLAAVETYYSNRKAMVQPFLLNVIDEGEISLFYFNGRYSHAIVKTPQVRDFRVQEEHGGMIRAVEPEAQLHAAGEAVLHSIDEVPLYARADFVRSNDGAEFWLMELELIEPSLYLRMDGDAPGRFAQAIETRVQEHRLRPKVSL